MAATSPDGPSERTRRGIRLVAAVLTLALVGLLAGALARESDRALVRFGGPLQHDIGWLLRSGSREAGHPITAYVELGNGSDVVPVIDGVALLDPSPGVRLRQALVTADFDGVHFGRFPPPIVARPAVGARIPSSDERRMQLALGIELAGPGRYWASGAIVRYHVGSQRYVAVILEGFAVCLTHGHPTLPRCRGTSEVRADLTRVAESLPRVDG